MTAKIMLRGGEGHILVLETGENRIEIVCYSVEQAADLAAKLALVLARIERD